MIANIINFYSRHIILTIILLASVFLGLQGPLMGDETQFFNVVSSEVFLIPSDRAPLSLVFSRLIWILFGSGEGEAFWSILTLSQVVINFVALYLFLVAIRYFVISLSAQMVLGCLLSGWFSLSSSVLSDSLWLAITMIALSMLARFVNEKDPLSLVFFALISVLAGLTREISFYLVSLLFFYLFLSAYYHHLPKKIILKSFLLFGGLSLIWPMSNLIIWGYFSFTSKTGNHLLNWVFPAVGHYSSGLNYDFFLNIAQEAENKLPALRNNFELSAARSAIFIDLSGTYFDWLDYIKAWLSGMLMNIAMPQGLLIPAFLDFDRPSFIHLEGENVFAKSVVFLSSFPLAHLLSLIGILVLHIRVIYISAKGFYMAYFLSGTPVFSAVLFLFGSVASVLTGPIVGVKYAFPWIPVVVFCYGVGSKSLQRR